MYDDNIVGNNAYTLRVRSDQIRRAPELQAERRQQAQAVRGCGLHVQEYLDTVG